MTEENTNDQNTENTLIPGSDEYNQHMAAKFRQGKESPYPPQGDTTGTNNEVPAMPDGGFDKFYNKTTGEYNWQAHAKEADYRLNQQKGKQPAEAKATEAEQSEIKSIFDTAGVDMSYVENSLLENGSIPDDARQKFINIGIPESLINSYEENYAYRAQAVQKTSLEYVGGEAEWERIKSWTNSNLNDAERAQVNTALKGPGWKIVVDGLKARMASAPRESKLIQGNMHSAGDNVGYRSKSEMKRDMANPRYYSDPAFREMVVSRMHNATWDLDR